MRWLLIALAAMWFGGFGSGEARAERCGALSPLGPEHRTQIEGDWFDPWLLDEAIRHYTNLERCGRGLTALSTDEGLVRVATGHSEDMVRFGFFDHESPARGRRTLGDRMTAGGVTYRGAGENIFLTSLMAFGERSFYVIDQRRCRFSHSPEGPIIRRHSYDSLAREVVEGWMNSPGHRANILKPGWRRIGHGMAYRRDDRFCGRLYVTQNFAN